MSICEFNSQADFFSCKKNDSYEDKQVFIFIPTFKNEHLVLACIASCISQSYKNIRVVIVDNGSDKNDTSIHDKILLLNDERIIYLANMSNIGSQNNFHQIFSLAQSVSRFMVIPADQFLTQDCVEKLMAASAENPTANMIFPRQVIRDAKKLYLNHEVQKSEKPIPWPHLNTGLVSSNKMIEYFFNLHNLNSEWSHFTFIGALIDGALVRALGVSRAPLYDHGLEEMLCLNFLSFSEDVMVIDEPLLILYTNNQRFGTAARPSNNYTRYEPIFIEFQYLEQYEPLLIRRGFSLSKLYMFLLFKTIYTIFRYPGPVFLIIPKAINSMFKLTVFIIPFEIFFFLQRKCKAR